MIWHYWLVGSRSIWSMQQVEIPVQLSLKISLEMHGVSPAKWGRSRTLRLCRWGVDWLLVAAICLCVRQRVSRTGQLFCTTYSCKAAGRQTCPVFEFWPLSEVHALHQVTSSCCHIFIPLLQAVLKLNIKPHFSIVWSGVVMFSPCPSRCLSRAKFSTICGQTMMAISHCPLALAGESFPVPTWDLQVHYSVQMLLQGHQVTVGGLQLSSFASIIWQYYAVLSTCSGISNI